MRGDDFEGDLSATRRRRRVVGAAATTAAVLAAVATGTALSAGHEDTAPQPAHGSTSARPAPTPDPTPDVDTIVREGDLLSYAAGDDGSVLTVWRRCASPDQDDCRSAWQLQRGSDTHRGTVPGEGASDHRAGDAYVVKSWDSKGFVVDADGTVRPVTAGQPAEVTSDDVLVWGVNRLLAIDPAGGRTWPLPVPAGVDRWAGGVVASDGTAWVSSLVGRRVEIWWSKGAAPDAWQHHQLPSDRPGNDLPAYIAVAGDRVATVSGSDGATILPVVALAVTTDGGATWVDLRRDDLPFDTVDAMAATSDGTLFVATAGGERLFRTTDDSWTRFTEMPNPERIDVLVPAGDHVVAEGGTAAHPVLLALDARGRSTPITVTR